MGARIRRGHNEGSAVAAVLKVKQYPNSNSFRGGSSTEEVLHFSLVELSEKGPWNDLKETINESAELFLDATNDPVVSNEIDEFALVLFGYRYFRATGLEVNGDEFAEPIFGGGEGFIQDIGYIILAG